MNTEHEISLLIVELQRLGKANPAFQGAVSVRRRSQPSAAPSQLPLSARSGCSCATTAAATCSRHVPALAAAVPERTRARRLRSHLSLSFQALVGTLRAAKKRKIVDYAGEMLLQGAHDAVEVVLLNAAWTPAASAAPAAAH